MMLIENLQCDRCDKVLATNVTTRLPTPKYYVLCHTCYRREKVEQESRERLAYHEGLYESYAPRFVTSCTEGGPSTWQW